MSLLYWGTVPDRKRRIELVNQSRRGNKLNRYTKERNLCLKILIPDYSRPGVSFQPKVDTDDLKLRRGFVNYALEKEIYMNAKQNRDSESVVRDIRRNTRRKYSSEEKIRIVLEDLKGEISISELCRREGIVESKMIANVNSME